MSQVVNTIVSAAEVVGGIAAAPFTGGASLLLTAAGTASLVASQQAQSQASAASAFTGTTGGTSPGSTGTGTTTAATQTTPATEPLTQQQVLASLLQYNQGASGGGRTSGGTLAQETQPETPSLLTYNPSASGGGRTSGNTLAQDTEVPAAAPAYDPNASGGGRTSGNTLAQNTTVASPVAPTAPTATTTPTPTTKPSDSNTTTPTGTDPLAAGTQPPLTGGNAPGSSTYVVPTQFEIYQEQAKAGNLAQQQFEIQGLEQIVNLKAQESAAESSIMATTAARGLRMEGSPLYQLTIQKQRGQRAIGLAEQSFAASDVEGAELNQATWNQQMLNLSEQNYAIQTQLNNFYLSQFASTVSFGTSLLSEFWNPKITSPSSGYSLPSETDYLDLYGYG